MTNISTKEVEHTAELARLELNQAEKEKLTAEIGQILNYVDELSRADMAGVESISQISGLSNIARTDEVVNPNIREKLLGNAPATENGFIKVKKVFE